MNALSRTGKRVDTLARTLEPVSTLSRSLEILFSFAVGLVLFGDYLALSVSRLVSGSAGNWILFAAIVQAVALVLAVALGRLRGRGLDLPALGFVSMGALMLVHVADRALSGAALGDYGFDKVAAYFGVCAPALLLGIAIGRGASLPGARWLPWMVAPLLVMIALALVSDPRLLTVAYFSDLGIFFGFLVLPAHQGLAYCLAKCCLGFHALAAGVPMSAWRRAASIALIGALAGLMLLSGARGYCLAVCAALLVQWSLGRKRIGWTLIAVVLAAFFVRSFASEVIVDRFDIEEIGESLSYFERQQVWESAWTAFLDRPLFGQGPGGFAGFFHEEGRVYPHNLVLEVASELGAIGIACLLLMFGPAVHRIVCLWRTGAKPDGVQLFAIGFLVFSLVGAASVGDLIRNHFLFLALGLVLGAVRPATRTHRPGARALRPVAPALRPVAPALRTRVAEEGFGVRAEPA